MSRALASVDQVPYIFRLRPLMIWAGLSAIAFAAAALTLSGLRVPDHGMVSLLVFWAYWGAVAWFGFRAITRNKRSNSAKPNVGQFFLVSLGITALCMVYAALLTILFLALNRLSGIVSDEGGLGVSSALVGTATFFSLLWHGQVLLEIAAGAKTTLRAVSVRAIRVLPGIAVCALGLGTASSIADHELSKQFSDLAWISDVLHWVLGVLSILLTGWFRNQVSPDG